MKKQKFKTSFQEEDAILGHQLMLDNGRGRPPFPVEHKCTAGMGTKPDSANFLKNLNFTF